MKLIDSISGRDPHNPLFLLDNCIIDMLALCEARHQYSGVIDAVAGKSVALCLNSPLAMAMSLIFLDGVCQKITLMPREGSLGVTNELLKHSNSQIVISDYLDAGSCDVRVVPFITSVGSLPDYTYETEWLLATSGTTGTPKLIPHTLTSLSRTVKSDNRGSSLRWGSLYDIRRFAGLQVYLQALLGGSSLVLFENSALSLSETVSQFCATGVNALSATPTMWQKILMTSGSDRLNLQQITLGGEIVRQRVLDALSLRYPGARLTHIYASTEFGVGFSVTDRKEGFPAAWARGQHAIMRIDAENGELLLRKGDAWIATGDVVEERDGRVLFKGRLNGSINVGGNKVMPEEVEHVLLQYPGVQLASVSAQQSSFMGNLVCAELTAAIDESQEDFRKKVIAHCRQHLEPYKVPAFIKIVDEVPTSPTGKILRKGGVT